MRAGESKLRNKVDDCKMPESVSHRAKRALM